MKKIILLLFPITLLVSNVFAGWITEGTNAYVKIQAINHWQGLLAGTICVAVLTAIKKMKPSPFKWVGRIKAGTLLMCALIAFGFFFAEYYPAFEMIAKGVKNIIEVMIA